MNVLSVDIWSEISKFLTQKENLIIRSIYPALSVVPIQFVHINMKLFNYILEQKIFYGCCWNKTLHINHLKININEIGNNNMELIDDILNVNLIELEITCNISAAILCRLLNSNTNLQRLTLDCGFLTSINLIFYELINPISLPKLTYFKTTDLLSNFRDLNVEEFYMEDIDISADIDTLLLQYNWSKCR